MAKNRRKARKEKGLSTKRKLAEVAVMLVAMVGLTLLLLHLCPL